jgi:hypothetical protein
VTVSVKAAPPALANPGEIPLATGTGAEAPALTTWLTEFDVLPVKFVSPL